MQWALWMDTSKKRPLYKPGKAAPLWKARRSRWGVAAIKADPRSRRCWMGRRVHPPTRAYAPMPQEHDPRYATVARQAT